MSRKKELMLFSTEEAKDRALAWMIGLKECMKGLEWSLTCGVLLGAVRGGEFINWDFDIDCMMHRKHEPEMERIVRCLKKKGYKANKIIMKDDKPTILQLQTFIQITKDGVPGHIALRDPTNFGGTGYFKFGKVKLRGVEFPAPGNVENFLTEMYGRDWRIPKPTPGWKAIESHVERPGHPVPVGAWHD